ncbi:MAG: hypothetical protein ACRELF_17560 [Gemmataceae bacterium]
MPKSLTTALFGTSLSPDEVEISEELFVVTAEEAKMHVEPPRLATLMVSRSQATIEPGKKQTFTAKGLDQHGRDIDARQVGCGEQHAVANRGHFRFRPTLWRKSLQPLRGGDSLSLALRPRLQTDRHERRGIVSDSWIKPDFQEIGVSGECTAYAGTQDAWEANALSACREANERASGEALFSSEPEA